MGEGNGQIWIWSQKRTRRKTNKTRSGGNKNGLPTSNKGETGDTRRTWSTEKGTRQLTRAMLEAVEQTILLQEKIKKKWITQETLRLVEEKRELKKRRDISEDAERTYRTKSNEVRKAARKDKAKWLEDQC